MAECQELHSGSVPVGGTWRGADISGNAVSGRFYGPNSASCTLPNNMDGCVFFSAAGARGNPNGALQTGYGRYWSSTEDTENEGGTGGYALNFNSSSSSVDSFNKNSARPIRCVQ